MRRDKSARTRREEGRPDASQRRAPATAAHRDAMTAKDAMNPNRLPKSEPKNRASWDAPKNTAAARRARRKVNDAV